MTSRERLLKTLKGETVDRPAVSFYEIGGFDINPDDPDEYNVYNHPSWRPLLQLANGIAHEVRNPLSIILGSIQYLRTIQAQWENEVTEHLNVMAESCGLIESVINELVNFARPITMVFESMDINACLKKTVSLLKYRCQKRKIDLLLELDPDLPLIVCDEQHIGQACINLIINAIPGDSIKYI